MNEDAPASTELLYRVKDIVAAYVSNNLIPAADLPRLITSSHEALRSLTGALSNELVSEAPVAPAVPIKKSVTPDHLVCLECGKTFISIKRHLANAHQLAPDQYREKWSLQESYPVVAPTYSERRSNIAKQSGLGRDRGSRAVAEQG
jgi:predicted transcriptional regulator